MSTRLTSTGSPQGHAMTGHLVADSPAASGTTSIMSTGECSMSTPPSRTAWPVASAFTGLADMIRCHRRVSAGGLSRWLKGSRLLQGGSVAAQLSRGRRAGSARRDRVGEVVRRGLDEAERGRTARARPPCRRACPAASPSSRAPASSISASPAGGRRPKRRKAGRTNRRFIRRRWRGRRRGARGAAAAAGQFAVHQGQQQRTPRGRA